MKEDDIKNGLLPARHWAMSVLGVLEELRANDVGRALELLEAQLDNSVLWMNGADRQVDAQERERSNEILRMIRDYRNTHPRRPESNTVNLEHSTLASLGRIQERVRKILDETE